jgi:hypothetical protein
MGTTITFRRGDNDPTSGSGLTLAEPAFNTTLKTFHIGLGHGITAAWVGAPISGLSADIAAGITYKIPSAAAVKNYIGGLCYGNTGAPTITQYVSSFNGLTGAVGGVCAAQANTFTALQSFANGISASGITVNGNMSVTGNFTVSGGVTFTASETVLIEDNTITLNSNVTGSPNENAGIEIERGTSANVQLLWNESSDRWTFTNDGSTYYDLPTSVVTSFNGLTGAVTGVTVGGANTFTALNTFNAGISAAGGTFSALTVFTAGISAGGGITFANDISVNGIRTGRGGGNLDSNTAVGSQALQNNTIYGYDNTVVGANALVYNTTGSSNTAMGRAALSNNTTGGNNSAMGWAALSNNTTGGNNTVVGANALVYNTTGSNNVAIGLQAGTFYSGDQELFDPENSIYIGAGAMGFSNSDINTIVIGSSAIADGANTTVIGNSSTTSTRVFGTLSTNGGISAAGGTFSALTVFTAGLSAAGATFGGTVTAPTPAVGTNNTQVATTAFVQNEIVADAVTAFNGRTGSVQGVSSAAAGTGIFLNAATGAVTITNTGVLSFNGNTGAVQGVSSAAAGTGIFVSAATGAVTITNTGVQSFNGATGAVQGVSAAVAGSFITVSSATGSVTITNTGVQSFNGLTGAVTGVTVGGVNTFTALNTFNAGISSAGGTFSALTRFTAGISASGGTFGNVVSIGNSGGQCIIKLPGSSTIFDGNGLIRIQPTFSPLTVTDAISSNEMQFNTTQHHIVFYDNNDGDTITLKADIQVGSGTNPTVTIPNYTTTIAGLAGTQTFTGTNTFNTLTNFGAGISSAGGTFSALTVFTAGISAAGGMTLAGSFQGSTAAFSGLSSFSAGLSASGGITFSSTTNTLNIIASTDGAGLRIAKGSAGHPTRTGGIRLGMSDTTAFNTYLENQSGTFSIYNGVDTTGTKLVNFNSTGNVLYGLNQFPGGISAAGGMTLAGTVSLNGQTFTNVVSSVNGSTGAVTTYAGTTGNIQFRYGSGVTANNTFTLSTGFEYTGEETEWFTISGYTYGGGKGVAVGNVESKGIRINRSYAELGLDEGGAVAIEALGVYDTGSETYGSSLYLTTPNTDIGADITIAPKGVNCFAFSDTVAYSDVPLVAGETFTAQGTITGATATFSRLTTHSAGISASGGMTLAGSFQGSTAAFSGLGSFSAGLSAAGTTAATFGGTVNMGFNTLFQPTMRYYNEVVAYPTISGGGLTLDISSAQVFGVTLDAGVNTLSITNTPATANRSIGFTLILTADGTPRGITWGAAVKWANNDPPALTSTNGKRDILSFVSPDGGTNWYAFIAGLNF